MSSIQVSRWSLSLGLLALGAACGGDEESDADYGDDSKNPAGATPTSDAGATPQTDAAATPATDAGATNGGAAPDAGAADWTATARIFRSDLNRQDEVPLCDKASAQSIGAGRIAVATDGSAVLIELEARGLSGAPSAAHLHVGAPGVAGPIALNLNPAGQTTVRKFFTAADYTPPANGPANFAALVTAITAGGTYLNVHTSACPMGEIRGQIRDAQEQAVALQAALDPKQEVPLCASAGAKARGAALLAADRSQQKLRIRLEQSGLSGAPTLAHIHMGNTGAAGPIVMNLASLLTGSGDATFGAAELVKVANGPTSFDELVTLLQRGGAYLNVHTAACPMGEIRGQVAVGSAR